MAMQGNEPESNYRQPWQYYLWLKARGYTTAQAGEMIRQRFGNPEDPEARQRRLQKEESNRQLTQVGGSVVGLIGGKYFWDNYGQKWIDKLTGKPTSEEIVKQTAKQFNQQMPTTGTEGAGTTPSIDATTARPAWMKPVGQGNTIPQGQPIPEGYVGVGTSADGGTIVAPQQYQSQLPNDPGFLESVNWNAVAGGAITLLQAYQAYNAYKKGDYVGAGIATGAAISAGAATANAAGASFAGSQTLSAAAPYLGTAAGLYQGYQTAQMIGDTAAGSQRNKQSAAGGAAAGATIGGSWFGIYGAAIGAAVGALAGLTGSWTGSKKGKAQFMRDNIRGVLQQNGILNENWQGTLADGSLYDFGKDGSTLKWKEIDKIAQANPNSWSTAVDMADALAAGYGFVGQKASDLAAWYAKGAVSNAGDDPAIAAANMRHIAQQQGINPDIIKQKLDEALRDNRINQSQYDRYWQGAQALWAQREPSATQPPFAPTQPKPPEQKQEISLRGQRVNVSRQRDEERRKSLESNMRNKG